VVGAGAAGLFASLVAARAGARVTLVSARPLAETASYWAQGGLAAALAVEDSPQLHLEDTLRAGRDLVRRSAAEVLTNEAPARFRDLEELGVRFDADRRGRLALGLEGGHRVRRVAHAGGSATGRRILRQLSADVVEHPDIEVLEGRRVTALLEAGARVGGAQLDDGRLLVARAVILASGGAAALWSRTTNPPGSYGSGLLLARAAGADLADLELVSSTRPP
jgi:L-aspartate oxidase